MTTLAPMPNPAPHAVIINPHQQPLCVDDRGVSVYACHVTGRHAWADDCELMPASTPGLREQHVCAPGTKAEQRALSRGFHEAEANCNTCAHLMRTKHAKCRHGFLEGACGKDGHALRFHPDDPLHMACYVSRWDATVPQSP